MISPIKIEIKYPNIVVLLLKLILKTRFVYFLL